MLTCPRCHAGVPEGMRFCLQCGALLAPTAPHAAPVPQAPVSAPPQPPQKASSTVRLRIAPTPVMAPRAGVAQEHPRPSLGDDRVEIDDESLKRSFQRPVTQPGAVVCRFCKWPLDLDGDFCEQCGAPVAEAAPPGTLKPKPQPAAPPVPPPPTPAPLPSKPGQAALPARPPAGSAPAYQPSAAPLSPAKPATLTEPTHPTPAPVAPTSSPIPPPPGFMGRLKGLFKKG
jgi:hypothetical protein